MSESYEVKVERAKRSTAELEAVINEVMPDHPEAQAILRLLKATLATLYEADNATRNEWNEARRALEGMLP